MGVARDLFLMPVVVLGAAVLAVEKTLMLLVQLYDVTVYSPLQMALSPIVKLVPRHVTVWDQKVDIFTANIVSWTRTLLVVPIAISLKYGYPWVGFWLVMLHDFLDHLDGIVAKVQRESHPGADDPLLGGFMDAFCDKIVNVFSLWSILMIANFSAMTPWYGTLYVTACTLIIGYEFVLGVVRVQDYFRSYYVREFCGEKKGSQTGGTTAAVMVGKLKEKLESVGIACLCLAHSQAACVAGVIGVTCLLLSIRLAHASLAEKLSKRKPTPDDAKDQEKEKMEEERMEKEEGKSSKATSEEENDKWSEENKTAQSSEEEEEETQKPEVEERKPDISDDEIPKSEPLSEKKQSKSHEKREERLETERLQEEHVEFLDVIFTDNRRRPSLLLTELDCRMDRAYTVGCFDLFHDGHVLLLRRMRAIAKQVIVGVHDSRSIYQLKRRVPIDSTETRMRNVKDHADMVFCVAGTDPSTFIFCIFSAQKGSAVYIRGDDMINFPAREVCEELMEVKFLPYTEGISSTKLRKELLNSTQADARIDRDDMHLFY